MAVKEVIIDAQFRLRFDDEKENEHDDSALVGEIGVLAYLESHAGFIFKQTFSLGSRIIENSELQAESEIRLEIK
jgi:hypothetical protein